MHSLSFPLQVRYIIIIIIIIIIIMIIYSTFLQSKVNYKAGH